jgi:hypothetical protein
MLPGAYLRCNVGCDSDALLDDYFIREEERGSAIVELHQKHAPIEIIDLAQDTWLLTESAATFVVPHRFLQLAMPPHHRLSITARHHFVLFNLDSGIPATFNPTYDISKHRA